MEWLTGSRDQWVSSTQSFYASHSEKTRASGLVSVPALCFPQRETHLQIAGWSQVLLCPGSCPSFPCCPREIVNNTPFYSEACLGVETTLHGHQKKRRQERCSHHPQLIHGHDPVSRSPRFFPLNWSIQAPRPDTQHHRIRHYLPSETFLLQKALPDQGSPQGPSHIWASPSQPWPLTVFLHQNMTGPEPRAESLLWRGVGEELRWAAGARWPGSRINHCTFSPGTCHSTVSWKPIWKGKDSHICGCNAMSLQLCPTLCNPMGSSLLSSSIRGILLARILEWVAMHSSRRSSQPRDWTGISYVSCMGRRVLYH